nr:MAG TPA: hypothetical protein [Caudoviricetes sp.]
MKPSPFSPPHCKKSHRQNRQSYRVSSELVTN